MTAIRYPLDYTLLANIPAPLLELPQWVCAELTPRDDGGMNKIPMNPATGRLASSTDPATWGTFAQAAAMAEARGWAVGFVLIEGGGLVAIDLDHCIDDAGTLSPEAAAIVERFATYAERSVSGTGVHLLCWSDPKPGTSSKRTARGIEVYDRARFMVMTGDMLPGSPPDLEPRTEKVHALYRELWPDAPAVPARDRLADPAPILSMSDEAILTNARTMHGFRRLYDGADTGAYNDDDSSADLGLLCYFVMAGATDPAQLDRLYRSSPLARGKWDERRGAMTYGERTIARALDGRVQPFEGFAPSGSIRLGEISATRFAPSPQDAGTAIDIDQEQDDTGADDLPDDPATLKQYIRELTRHIEQMRQERDQMRQEQERMRQRLVMLSDVQSRAAAIQRNKAIGQLRPVAIAAMNFLANRETAEQQPADGMHPIYLEAFGEAAGVSDDIASKKLTILSESGAGLRKQTRTERRPDGTLGKRVYIGLEPGTTVADFGAAVATMDTEQRQWGGRRMSCPTCGPAAAVEKRTTTICRGCGEVLSERVQILPPLEQADASAEPNPHLAGTVRRTTVRVEPVPEPNPQDAGTDQTRPQWEGYPPVVPMMPLSSGTVSPASPPSMPLPAPGLDRYTDPRYGRTG